MSNNVQTSLIYSKTKVAPLKVQSILRLELCAAVLLTRALEFVRRSMKLTKVSIYCWSDSSVVLAWLQSVPTRWETFVANRVSEIQSGLPAATWQHVSISENPVDSASRGMSAAELISHGLWWQGPPWLKYGQTEWPANPSNNVSETEVEERKSTHAHLSQPRAEWKLPEEVSS